MRTKHILTALAIPALFAACVADDFNEAVTGSDMAQRALLSEDFKLNFGGPDTRFSAGEGSGLSFSYETGDKIGGAIIDEFSYGDNKEKVFTVVPYVSTNHPFVRNEQGEWTIEHTMVEGNYLFYFPYNENNHARTAPMYSIPVMQDLSGANGKFDPKAAVEKYSMAVGAQFLDKEDLSASLQLVNIFGYARIKVVVDNHYAGGEVDKIVLQPSNDKKSFKLNGQISNITVSNLYKNLETSTTAFQNALEAMTTTEAFAIQQDSEIGGEANYYDADLNQTSPVIVGKAPEGTALVEDAQRNKTFETYLVMPATAETDAMDINVYLYTTDGRIYVGTMQDFYVPRNGVNGETVTVSETESVPYVVTSEADWNNSVEMLSRDEEAKFIIANNNFTITNTIEYPTNGATINVAGDLKVSGNNVTMKYVKADNVIIEKGAKLTTDGTFSAESIENEGTVEFAVVYDEEDEDLILDYGSTNVPGVGKVTNKPGAVLNVLKDAVATFTLVNEIDDKESSLPHGAVTINGQATLAGESENDGDITIAAGGSLRGQFTNNKEVTYPVSAQKEEDITNRYTPTITNNGEIYVTTGTVTNNGKIVNNDEISCSRTNSAARFENKGVIELGETVQMLISDNANGEIILNALDQTGWAVQSNIGIVSYRAKAADNDKSYDFTKVGTNITKLYVTGNLGVTAYGKLNNVVIEKNASLALPETTATAPGTLSELTVEEGVTAAVSSKNAVLGTLYVEKDARLTINENNSVTTKTVENRGNIYVGGSFATTNMSEEDAESFGGTFRNTVGGTTGNISFNTQVPDMEEGALKTALTDLYNTWFSYASKIAVDGYFNSWEKVTAENIADETTWTTSGWQKDAMNGVLKAAGIGDMTLEKFKEYLKEDMNAKVINDLAAAAKVEADKKLAEEIKKLDNTTWLGEDAYLEQTAGSIIKVGTENEEKPTTLAVGFVAYIQNATSGFLKDKSDKDIILSAGSYTYNAADVPANSYAPAYAGTSTYEVLEGLNTLANSDVVKGNWFSSDGSTKWTASQFNTLEGVKKAVIAVSDKMDKTGGDALTGAEKIIVEGCGITDAYVQEVILDWQYTDKTIEALNDLFGE